MAMLTIKDVAERLTVSERTVRRLIEDGSIRASKIGGQLRLKEDDVELYVNQQVVSPWPPAAQACAAKAPPKRRPGRPPLSGAPAGGYVPGMKVV